MNLRSVPPTQSTTDLLGRTFSRSPQAPSSPWQNRISFSTPYDGISHPSMTQRTTVPVKLMILLVLALCAVTPAALFWWISSGAMLSAINLMFAQGKMCINETEFLLRSTLIRNASSILTQMVTPSEAAIQISLPRVQQDDLVTLSSDWLATHFGAFVNGLGFITSCMKVHPWIASVVLELLTSNFTQNVTYVQKLVLLRMSFDTILIRPMDTIYLQSYLLNTNFTDTILTYYYLDPDTLVPQFPIVSQNLGQLLTDSIAFSHQTWYTAQWQESIVFHSETGIPMIGIKLPIPLKDGSAVFITQVYASVYQAVSAFQSVLEDEHDRLYMFFRNEGGVLIAASHGKYFSHSDIDWTSVDPYVNPPPISEFRTFTPLNSTDPPIATSGQWLLDRYYSWALIPELNSDFSYGSTPYWLTTYPVTSKLGLRVVMVLLVDTTARIGPVQEQWNVAQDKITKANLRSIILCCVVLLGSVGVALGISIAVTRPLDRLANGMNSLSRLNFPRSSVQLLQTSHVKETYACQTSFLILERGLKAFVMYVPKEVVTFALRGGAAATGDQGVHSCVRSNTQRTVAVSSSPSRIVELSYTKKRVVTVMFADIANFSMLCENTEPEQLIELMGGYLQAMCALIAENKGTLDKFIGDCIMAMWNAPLRVPLHETVACLTVLKMQTKLMELMKRWEEMEYPEIKFRAGINTCECLVGSVGCEYRYSYTCLGSGINLANRLEGINKHFGTVALVSEQTHMRASEDIFFRKIAVVCLKEIQLPVTIYEPLFILESTSPKTNSVKSKVDSRLLQRGIAEMSSVHLSRNTSEGESVCKRFLHRSNEAVVTSSSSIASEEVSNVKASDSELSIQVRLDSSPFSSNTSMSESIAEVGILPEKASVYHLWHPTTKTTLCQLAAFYHKGLVEYIRGNFHLAASHFLHAIDITSGYLDRPSHLLLSECRRYTILSNSAGTTATSSYSPLDAVDSSCCSSYDVIAVGNPDEGGHPYDPLDENFSRETTAIDGDTSQTTLSELTVSQDFYRQIIRCNSRDAPNKTCEKWDGVFRL